MMDDDLLGLEGGDESRSIGGFGIDDDDEWKPKLRKTMLVGKAPPGTT